MTVVFGLEEIGAQRLDEACRAGASPLLRFEALDSSARLALRDELAAAPEASGVGSVVLTYRWADQARFKADVSHAKTEIAARQRGQWLSDPRGIGVITLAFTTDPRGALTGLHESSATAQLYRAHELGSLAKLPALAFLAGRGWGEQSFCNRQAWLGGKQLHNAGNDQGVLNCAPGTGMRADEVWGRSLSLAVYDALLKYDDASLRASARSGRPGTRAQQCGRCRRLRVRRATAQPSGAASGSGSFTSLSSGLMTARTVRVATVVYLTRLTQRASIIKQLCS